MNQNSIDINKIGDYIVTIVLIVMIISILYVTFLMYNGTYRPGYATGDSNQPYIDNGSFIIKEGVDSINDIEEGDIISYKPDCYMYDDSDYIVHMVIDERDDGLITMGMNNDEPDQVVYYNYSNDYNSVSDHIRNIDNATVHNNTCQPMVTNDSITGEIVYHTNQTNLVNTIQTIRDIS